MIHSVAIISQQSKADLTTFAIQVMSKVNTFQWRYLPALHIPAVFAVELFDPSGRSPVNAESLRWSISLFVALEKIED